MWNSVYYRGSLRIIKDQGGPHVKSAGHRPIGGPGYPEPVIAETWSWLA